MNFWDTIWSNYRVTTRPGRDDPVLEAGLAHFGDVRGKRLVDLGCGSGKSSIFFADLGANVIAIDRSEVAIINLRKYCKENDIPNIEARKLDAQRIDELGTVDLVYGSMILHHIEPFTQFVDSLRKVLRPRGKAFFFENNANSKILLWARDHLVGRWWIPKAGDPDEYPLTPDEVEQLRKRFPIEIVYPYLHFFRLFPEYVLRNRLRGPFVFLDQVLFRYPAIRKLSYTQYIFLG